MLPRAAFGANLTLKTEQRDEARAAAQAALPDRADGFYRCPHQ
jgi:hypothetical protein